MAETADGALELASCEVDHVDDSKADTNADVDVAIESGKVNEPDATTKDVEMVRRKSSGEIQVDEEGHDPALPPLRGLKFAATRPRTSWILACGGHIFMALTFATLFLVFGSGFVPFTSSVPLYLRSHWTKQRDDALTVGMEVANYNPGRPQLQLSRSVSPQGADTFGLEVIYVSKSGSIWQQDTLQDILRLEARIRGTRGYEKYCLVQWSATAKSATVAAQQSEDYSNITLLNMNVPDSCVASLSPLSSCVPAAGLPCSDVASMPPGLLDCKKPLGCTDDDFEPLNESFWKHKVKAYASMDPLSPVAPANSSHGLSAPVYMQMLTGAVGTFYRYPSTDFGIGNDVVPVFRTIIPFGLPLEGYATIDDRYDEQEKQVADWAYGAYQEMLSEVATDNVEVWFNGPGFRTSYIESQLQSDAKFAVGAFVFVLVYIALMTRSWWLAFMGMGQILFSFFSAYLIYFGVFGQRYFGVFNMLSIFLILGIGADDIFVFLDTFNASELLDENHTLSHKLSWTWRKAAKAMFVTSLTTMISFLTNASSGIPAIQTFGIFSSMLVFVNYMSVIIYYPTVVAVYQTYLRKRPFCCGLDKALYKCIHCCLGEKSDAERTKSEKKKLGRIEAWFRDVYAPFLTKRKWILIVISLAFFAFMAYEASLLESDPDMPALLPEDNNFQKFWPLKGQHYRRGGNIFSITVTLAWGLKRSNPIDRTGTEPTDQGDMGIPVWDSAMDPARGANCLIEVCDKTEIANADLSLGGAPAYTTTCWLRDFKHWVVASTPNGTAKWDQLTGPGAPRFKDSEMKSLLTQWVAEDPTNTVLGNAFAAEPTTEGASPNFRFMTASLKLTQDRFIPFEEGVALSNRWEVWFNKQLQIGECESVKDSVQGFQTGWSFFYVQEQLGKDAFSGIAYAVIAALVVLTLATGNIVVAVLSTVTIVFIIVNIMGFTVLMGWKLGMLESVNFVMVPGMSVDFVAHLAEGYMHSHHEKREDRVRDMLLHVGVSVTSGALSTLGATMFLFFPTIMFFRKFGLFIFMTIIFSLYCSLVFFSAVMVAIGPEGNCGQLPFGKLCCCKRQDVASSGHQKKALTMQEEDQDLDKSEKDD